MCVISKVLHYLGVATVLMLAVGGQVASGQLASNSTPITVRTDGSVRLQFQGAAGSSFEIQSADSLTLPYWQILADQMADSNGFVIFTDTNASPVARFYRPTTPTIAPVATNTEVAGDENAMISVFLGGTDPVNQTNPLSAIITSLPAQGTIYQYNSNAITSVPALVTDSQHRALFLGAPNDSGSNYAAFTYVVRRDSDGVASAPSRVQMDLNFIPYPPIATTPVPSVLENQSGIIQFTFINPNAKHGDPIRVYIADSTVNGSLCQVLADNITPGAQITGQVFVSNTNYLVYYKPPDFGFGYNYDSFTYIVINSENQESTLMNVPINVIHVDQPIYASPTTFTVDPSSPSTTIAPSVTAVDSYPITLYFTNMPQNGYLYVSSVAPQNLVTPTNNGFNINDQFIFVRQYAGECGVTNDTGFPYVTLGYVVTNTVGKTASATITINVPPAPAPPFLTGPTSYVLQENSNVVFSLTGSSPETNSLTAVIQSLPQHGSLYFMRNNQFTLLTGAPFYYDTNASLMYVPAKNYFGVDSIPVSLQDPAGNVSCNGTNFGGNPISFTVQEVNLPPSVQGSAGGSSAVIVYDDSNNVTSVIPATLIATASDPDALPTDLERITIRALKNGQPADGQLFLLTTNGLVGLQFTNPVQCTFEGTLATINTVLNSNFEYTPTGGTLDADSVIVTLNDEGHNGVIYNPLQASATLSITYVYQGGGSIPIGGSF